MAKPLADFGRHKGAKDGRRAECRPCHSAEIIAWKRNHPAKVQGWNRKSRRGVTVEQYEAMLAAQGGGCAICGRPPDSRPLHVDHAHDTGRTRALLCDLCNRGLGYFAEEPDRLRVAAAYIEAHR